MAGEWRDTTLGQLTDFLSGGTPSKDVPRYWGGSIPWVSAKDMKRFRLDDTEDHVTEHGVAKGTKLVPTGTVLLLARGMTLLNDLPICVANRPMTFNQDVKALRPKPGIRNDFLPYLLLGNKERLLNLVDLAGHGTGRLNSDELKALDVVLPPESDQRAIAHILGTLDDKIELNQRMNETLEAIARELFRSWFVDFDPVRAKFEGREPSLPPLISDLFPDSFEDSELGEIPTGWEVRGIDEIARFLNGLALQKFPPRNGRSLPVIKIAQLRSGTTKGADAASADLASEYVVEDGDVLFSWSGSLECVLWAGGRGALNQHLFKVTSATFPKWLYYLWIQQHLPDFRHIAAAKATTMGHIQRHHLSEAKVVLPPRGLLQAVDKYLSPLVEAVPKYRIESRTLAAVRDVLLPTLISGELRIEDAERIVERVS
ncbi:MAG: restriction endonuclease subunit S [Candidatus Solibacter sp.]|jgi:type I restriction enzyme S subunit